MRLYNRSILSAVFVVLSLILAACGGGGAAQPTAGERAGTGAAGVGGEGVTIRYQLWDSNQQPAYQACADKFHEENPGITVKIEQLGWGDYWSGIQTGMVGGTAPDVFTNHLAKYPEFAAKNQLVDIEPMVQRDGVDLSVYYPGLADLWTRDGKRFGLPKDWDTVALVYNADMLEKAGVDPASLKDLTWNAQDGGTFGELIKKLTLDSNGKNALDPAFDKTKVVQYGFIPQGAGGFSGQTQWSMFAASNGFKFTDGPWATKYYYDDPKLAETLQWYANLHLVEGVAPSQADVSSQGGQTLFTAGKGALTTDGSWTIGDYLTKSSFKVGFAPLPKGPEGRKSMFNGLADSIWVGSKHQEEAWQWVKFAASKTCADIVGGFGVVFPAQQSGVDAALAKRKADGVDVTAFTDQAKDPNGTFLFPITDHGAEIATIMDSATQSIMLGQATAADALKQANEEVNALFK
ncbi:MAG TPA: sugar ABC transporter substrate-binding protein [Roseiflexaceae bacterium]|nr:sugar ABC transporter substrate-binding protein [Roseiflexaceae bacterium]